MGKKKKCNQPEEKTPSEPWIDLPHMAYCTICNIPVGSIAMAELHNTMYHNKKETTVLPPDHVRIDRDDSIRAVFSKLASRFRSSRTSKATYTREEIAKDFEVILERLNDGARDIYLYHPDAGQPLEIEVRSYLFQSGSRQRTEWEIVLTTEETRISGLKSESTAIALADQIRKNPDAWRQW